MKASDWIKVTDSLPELGEDVLVSGSFDGIDDTDQWFTHRTDDSGVLTDSNGFAIYSELTKITHWMRIVPPKGGGKEQKKVNIHPAITNVLTVTNYSNLMSSVTSRDKNKEFEEITDRLNRLYTKKNAAYDNSFSKTFNSLGIISAVTRIGDKYNRLENLVKNSNIDNLGESIEDTLMDLASYSIMTLMELNKASN